MGWIVEYLGLLLLLFVPIAGFAIVAHFLEYFIQTRLAQTFGWRSVLWTGWLGTPIHEFSHAVMCWIFRHRIDEIRLFDPDLVDGRLGFVRHSYRRGNIYQEIGNVFIGTAPLLGGLLVLALLTWLFYPQAIQESAAANPSTDSLKNIAGQLWTSIWASLRVILNPTNVVTARFWCYCYLVVCVGCHMAPSRSDYAGSLRGLVLILAMLAIASILVGLFGGKPTAIAIFLLRELSPLAGVASLSLAGSAAAAIVVFFATALFRLR